jgi:hypothetical protein
MINQDFLPSISYVRQGALPCNRLSENGACRTASSISEVTWSSLYDHAHR